MCVLMGGFVDCSSQDSLKFVLAVHSLVIMSRARHF